MMNTSETNVILKLNWIHISGLVILKQAQRVSMFMYFIVVEHLLCIPHCFRL
jgi:hypothetical protein